MDYNRIYELKNKVDSETASSKEKKEYALLLYETKSISKEQYDGLISEEKSNEVWNFIKTAGSILLIGYLVKELLKD